MKNLNKTFKYEKDHLYKQCQFTPDWSASNPIDNWKIHEIVNKSHTYEEALAACEGAGLEEVDTIIREKLITYFKPETLTYGELKEKKN
jgi:hypothetical protein